MLFVVSQPVPPESVPEPPTQPFGLPGEDVVAGTAFDGVAGAVPGVDLVVATSGVDHGDGLTDEVRGIAAKVRATVPTVAILAVPEVSP